MNRFFILIVICQPVIYPIQPIFQYRHEYDQEEVYEDEEDGDYYEEEEDEENAKEWFCLLNLDILF